MFMDPGIRGLPDSVFQFGNHMPSPNSMSIDCYRFDGFDHGRSGNFQYVDGDLGFTAPVPVVNTAVDKDLEFSEINSDINLRYITKMIMEENMEDKGYMHQGDSSLFCADKPSFDIVNSSSLTGIQEHLACPRIPCDGGDGPHSSCRSGLEDDNWVNEFLASWQVPKASIDHSSPSSFSSSGNNSNAAADLIDESQLSSGSFPELFLGNRPLWQRQFKKGREEANKFLPEINKLVIGLESNGVFESLATKGGIKGRDAKMEKEKRRESRGRKNSDHVNLDLEEGRNIKQSATYEEGVIRSKIFDEVLLCKNGTCTDTISALIETLKNEANQSTKKSKSKGTKSGGSRGKKQGKKEVVDLRTILIHCAQSVAADDHRNANELLRQIRQHSSVSGASGDATQKLAQIFADGLEARLAGTGSQVYHSLMAKKQSAIDILKAHRLYIAACPFKRISHFFANQTILNVSKTTTRLHIIDYGINFGFQWPCLIQQLSMIRPGGPPKLRITGIDVPQPGFRPRERIDETGRRLADYCRTFNVPFEYRGIVSKWEDIQVEDLEIKKDEVLVVNCLYRFRNLADETVFVDSPRNIVLNNIRKMNPDVFIHCVINGSYSAPFFVTRFREALFFYSSLFDMLETTIPRNHSEKLLIENEIFGREAINVVACEGSEREERPETYKQWQVRSLRAGFKQLPVNPDILKAAKDKVRSSYHKDFVIDEDGRWLLQGWKGRIIYALSTWMPTAKGF